MNFGTSKSLCLQVIDSMWRTLSYSARLDEPAAGKVLVTAFWGCLGDQGSGTNNYKGPRRGKGIETWPSAFSKYCFKKKTKFLVRHLGRLPEEQKQGLLVATNGSPRLLKSTNQKQGSAPETEQEGTGATPPRVCAKEKVGAGGESFTGRKHKKQQKKESSELKLQHVK